MNTLAGSDEYITHGSNGDGGDLHRETRIRTMRLNTSRLSGLGFARCQRQQRRDRERDMALAQSTVIESNKQRRADEEGMFVPLEPVVRVDGRASISGFDLETGLGTLGSSEESLGIFREDGSIRGFGGGDEPGKGGCSLT